MMLDDKYREAFCIQYGIFNGSKWNWDTMSWETPDPRS
jgi:hypothetical protein